MSVCRHEEGGISWSRTATGRARSCTGAVPPSAAARGHRAGARAPVTAHRRRAGTARRRAASAADRRGGHAAGGRGPCRDWRTHLSHPVLSRLPTGEAGTGGDGSKRPSRSSLAGASSRSLPVWRVRRRRRDDGLRRARPASGARARPRAATRRRDAFRVPRLVVRDWSAAELERRLVGCDIVSTRPGAEVPDRVAIRPKRRCTIVGARVRSRSIPPARWRGVDLRELWEYRGLLYFLVWRDLKVRYKQTVFGGAWASRAAVPHDGGDHDRLRAAALDALGRRAVPALLLRGAGSVGAVRERHGACGNSLIDDPEPALEGLLPAPHAAAGGGDVGGRRLRHRLRSSSSG